jgi:hypothetical protein
MNVTTLAWGVRPAPSFHFFSFLAGNVARRRPVRPGATRHLLVNDEYLRIMLASVPARHQHVGASLATKSSAPEPRVYFSVHLWHAIYIGVDRPRFGQGTPVQAMLVQCERGVSKHAVTGWRSTGFSDEGVWME